MHEAEQLYLEAYKEYADAIFRYCLYKVSDRDCAKDLTQDVFIKTWNYIAKGEVIENWKAFLYRTAHNAIIDHYRTRTSESLDALAEKGFDPGENTVETLVDTLDGVRILQLVQSLSAEHRDVIVMRYVEGLSHSEIGAIIGQAEGIVRVRAYRGLKKLKALVAQISKQSKI